MYENIEELYKNYDRNDPVLAEYADLLYDEILDLEQILKEESAVVKDEHKYVDGIKPGAEEMAPAGHQWVYVFIVNAKEITTKVIRHFTKQPYNHAALSFDKSLTNMASFVMGPGFRRENIKNYKPEATFSLYKIAVPNDAVIVMKDAVNNIEQIKDPKEKYKYSLKGLIGFIDKRHQAKYNTNEKKMFCSQFVARMFATAGMKVFGDKKDYEIKPYDFAKNKNFKFCYRGMVKNYNPGRVR